MTTKATTIDTFQYVSPRDLLLNEIERLQAQRDALLSAAQAVALAYEEAGWSKDTRDAIFALNRVVAGATGGQA